MTVLLQTLTCLEEGAPRTFPLSTVASLVIGIFQVINWFKFDLTPQLSGELLARWIVDQHSLMLCGINEHAAGCHSTTSAFHNGRTEIADLRRTSISNHWDSHGGGDFTEQLA